MNPHYQRVRELDEQLPAPLRWLTHAMSSWWTIGVLGVFVVGYVAAALVPVGDRYLWQHRAIDSTQQTMLTWWPLMAGAWLLAIVVMWSALRRMPWRWDNLGRFIAALGLAIILVTQSLAFNGQTTTIAAVPVSTTQTSGQPDAMSLTYTTRAGDTTERVLVVMVGGAAPIHVPLADLPRWNDAAASELPTVKLHSDPKLASSIGYSTRITPVAYLADGTLIDNADGSQAATPTPLADRDTKTLPYPGSALLAIEFTADTEDGGTATTTVWLPFEPEGADALAPKQFFQVEGIGTVGLAFRPASRKLPFAMAASEPSPPEKMLKLNLHIADTDTHGRLLQPTQQALTGSPVACRSYGEDGTLNAYEVDWIYGANQEDGHAFVTITNQPGNLFITAGLITFILGVVLDFAMGWLGPKPKRNPPPQAKAVADASA